MKPARIPTRADEVRAVRRLGRRILDLAIDRTIGAGAGRAWSGASSAAVARRFAASPPRSGGSDAAVVRRLRDILDGSMRMSHPRLFGLFTPAPLPLAALGDMAAAFMNQSPDAWKAGPAATEVEAGLIRAFARMAGLGGRAFGAVTSGGGAANLLALKLARDRALGVATRGRGVGGREARRLRVYASDQAHFSIPRALDVLGIGSDALVSLPTGPDRRLDPKALDAVLGRDRRRGLRPLAIVATAGTTSTGTIDPLDALARVARRHRVPLHVDAAYGGALLVSGRHGHRLAGIERADTVSIDPHKWLFQPFSLALLLVRDRAHLAASCAIEPEYLRKDLEEERDRLDLYQHSLEGSRPFRALKLDLTLQALGVAGLGRLVDRTVAVAQHLERRVRSDPRFETCGAPVDCATVVLRYLPPGRATGRRLDAIQMSIQHAVERSGEAWFPAIRLDGAVWLRIGVFNYRTTEADVDRLLRAIVRAAGE